MKLKGKFSVLVSLAIIVGLISPPLKVEAEEVASVVASIGDTTYTSLKEAVEATRGLDDATITMQNDVIITKDSSIILEGKDYHFTIELNGKKIQQTPAELKPDGTPSSVGAPIKLQGGANLTVKDSIGGGEIYGHQTAIIVLNDSTFTLQSGELKGLWYGLAGNGMYHNTVININGGKISNNDPEGTGAAIYHPQTGKLNISGGIIIGDLGVQLCAGNGSVVNMNGGSITGTGANLIADKKGDGAIPDGAAISVVTRAGYDSVPTLNISGGTFISQQSSAIMAYTWENNTQGVWENANEKIQISGGTFSDASAANLVTTGNKLYAVGAQFKVAPVTTDIQLSPSSVSLEVGESVALQTTITPSNTLDEITYSSNHVDIASVDNAGNVTAIAPGVATITATAGGKSATSTITVTQPAPVPTPDKPAVNTPQIDTTKPVQEVTIGIQDNESKETITNTVISILDDISNGKEIAPDVMNEATVNAVKEALAAGKKINSKVSTNLVDVATIEKSIVNEVTELADAHAKANNKKATVAQYLDLSVFLMSDAQELGTIQKLNKEIQFTIVLPSDLVKQDRDFYVVRIHNGEVEKLDTVMNEDGTLTFKTDKFSTYALVYEEVVSIQTPSSSPATGIDNHSFLYLITMIGAVALFGFTTKQKKTKSQK